MSEELSGRHVVVTGGTGALGWATVRRLVELGATCHLPVLGEGTAPVLDGAEAKRVRLEPGVDLTDEATVTSFYRELPGLWASLHVAGGFAMAPVVETSRADLEGQLRMNAVTAFLCCREAVARMRLNPAVAEGRGRIVNVAARPALEPRSGAGMVAYTMAKAAVAALTEALAEEVCGDGIWVNAVVPSIMDTPANRRAMPGADHASWPSVADVAATAVFLASPGNAVTRGGLVPVYGKS